MFILEKNNALSELVDVHLGELVWEERLKPEQISSGISSGTMVFY